MTLYGDMDHIHQLLRPKDGAAIGGDHQARLDAIQVAVSSYIDKQTGRSFGDGPASGPATASSIVVVAPEALIYGQRRGASARLWLPKAIRTISSVAFDPVWSGTAWSGGTVVPTTEYVPDEMTTDGNALALVSVSGDVWFGRYLITGTWEDSDADNVVPADLSYIADYLIAEVFKAEQTSAAAVSGPDGATLPMKNPYKNPLVATVLDKYRVGEGAVVI